MTAQPTDPAAPSLLAPFVGEPLVVAFFAGTSAGAGGAGGGDLPASAHLPGTGAAIDELRRARAELRGLGASLLAVSGSTVWGFRPDVEEVVAAREDGVSAAALRARFELPEGRAGVFVLDADMRVQFAQTDATAPATFGAVVDAIAAAGRAALSSRQARGGGGKRWDFTRRQLVLGSLVAAFSAAFLAGLDGCRSPPPAPVRVAAPSANDVAVTLDVNGGKHSLRIDGRATLLDVLHDRLALGGTKKSCDQGQCGACTVLVDGRRVNACLTLALAAEGQAIATIEGLAKDVTKDGEVETLHPLQAAFIEEDGFQCGYCTAGQIMSAVGMLAEHRALGAGAPALDDDQIRERMSGNLCRCGAYPNIVAAIQRARKEM